MEDANIKRLLKQHDEKGLSALIGKYNRLACYVARSVLGAGSDADVLECVNDAYYGIWCSAPDTELSVSLRGWVCLIVRRRAIDALRRRGRTDMVHLDADMADAIAAPPDGPLLSAEGVARIERFAQELPEPNRRIFDERFFALRPIADIARDMGMSRGAVDARLSRMRGKLRTVLDEEGEN